MKWFFIALSYIAVGIVTVVGRNHLPYFPNLIFIILIFHCFYSRSRKYKLSAEIHGIFHGVLAGLVQDGFSLHILGHSLLPYSIIGIMAMMIPARVIKVEKLFLMVIVFLLSFSLNIFENLISLVVYGTFLLKDFLYIFMMAIINVFVFGLFKRIFIKRK